MTTVSMDNVYWCNRQHQTDQQQCEPLVRSLGKP